MNILPKTGIAEIKLGMSKQDILDLLGQPISKEENPDEDVWEIENDIELSFQKDDDYLLSTVTTSNPSALLDAKNIIGISEAEFRVNFPFFKIDEDFGKNGKSYWADDAELMVWVFDGVVSSVTVFPVYKEEDDTPIWPLKNT